MDQTQVAVLRSFHRVVTERVGALQDGYLERPRSLGASRVLWEVGEDGCDVRTLRARLDLDSGYLSRLLRTLEGEGLVSVTSSAGDRRRRAVRLTRAGRRERARLDRDSDSLAGSLLAALTEGQRAELVAAAATVERLLTAGMVTTAVEDPAGDGAQWCIGQYFAELDQRFDAGFDPALTISADVAELTLPAGLIVVARLRGEPVGCAALKLHGRQPAEVKRMWVDSSARGLGLGRRLLGEVEALAVEHGARGVRLETNRALTEAIALYRSAGYREVAAFNDEPFADHWFEKRLG